MDTNVKRNVQVLILTVERDGSEYQHFRKLLDISESETKYWGANGKINQSF